MSESEEMYLITIAHLNEAGLEGPVPIARLAEELSVVPGSANQMVKKLAATGLVHYLPYKGVLLTQEGHGVAAQVLRHRRLWESFLVDHLGLNLEEADSLACGMEHITTEAVADRLATYLGNPGYSPGGKPIPNKRGKLEEPQPTPLSKMQVGEEGTIEFIEASPRIQQFLGWDGFQRSRRVGVLARSPNGSLLIECEGQQIKLSSQIASSILIKVSQTEDANQELLPEIQHNQSL